MPRWYKLNKDLDFSMRIHTRVSSMNTLICDNQNPLMPSLES